MKNNCLVFSKNMFQITKIQLIKKEAIILKSLNFLKNKAKTLEDIWNNSQYIINDKIEIKSDDKKLIDDLSKKVIKDFLIEYEKLNSLSRETLEPLIKSLIEKYKTNFKGVGDL